jgi:hypothetical protein
MEYWSVPESGMLRIPQRVGSPPSARLLQDEYV